MPDVALTADMIVGFPGETEADHTASVAFARSMGFADVHVFRYSPRRGTAAARMAQHVAPEVKQRRAEELRAAVDQMAAGYRARFVGATRSVLWEERLPLSRKGGASIAWTGLTDNYLRVEMESEEELLGVTSDVQLARLAGDRFEGRLATRVSS
jgi:threonylcarbamoyladenosine tRNA methylthiotransferase MtaB